MFVMFVTDVTIALAAVNKISKRASWRSTVSSLSHFNNCYKPGLSLLPRPDLEKRIRYSASNNSELGLPRVLEYYSSSVLDSLY